MCRLCWGSGNFVCRTENLTTKETRLKWFSCPNCNGVGTTKVHSLPTIRMKNKLGKNIIKLNRRLDFKKKVG